jgi:hypothetical protein
MHISKYMYISVSLLYFSIRDPHLSTYFSPSVSYLPETFHALFIMGHDIFFHHSSQFIIQTHPSVRHYCVEKASLNSVRMLEGPTTMWDLSSTCCSHLEHRASVKRLMSLRFLNLRQSVGLLGRGISPTQGRYPHRATQTQNKRRRTSMPWVGFELTIPVLEREKIFHASDRAATAIVPWGIGAPN